MTEVPSNVRRLLEEHPWEETTARLLLHARNKIERLIWRGEIRGHPPGGMEACDVVQTVREKVLSGTRNWDPEEHPDLFEYLKDQIDSEISNAVRAVENQLLRRECSVPPGTLEPSHFATPERALLTVEEERQNEKFFLGFIDFLKNEPELQKVVETIVDGRSKPADIAQHLDVRVDEIYSRKKKLKRRLEEYRDQRIAANPPSKGGKTRG